MIPLAPEQTATLKNWFLPDRPGPLIGLHVIHTGNGTCLVDRWPAPQVVLVETAGNYTLLGAAHVLTPADIQPHLKGFVETSAAFAPLLKAAFPNVRTWPRIIFEQRHMPGPVKPGDYSVRRLEPSDADHLWGLGPESAWISNMWGDQTVWRRVASAGALLWPANWLRSHVPGFLAKRTKTLAS